MNADYANALKYGLECLEKELLLIGDYNYITANSYYFIADCYGGLNDFENAVSYCKKSLSIRQQVLGDQSIDYLSSLYILSTIYYITNEPDSTIKYGTKIMYSLRMRQFFDVTLNIKIAHDLILLHKRLQLEGVCSFPNV